MMKILKYKKDRNNTYKVYFDEDLIINLYDDVIIKYNLLTLKNISKELFDEIVKYNSFLDGYYNSIKYIKNPIWCVIIVKVLNFAQIRYILLLSSIKF